MESDWLTVRVISSNRVDVNRRIIKYDTCYWKERSLLDKSSTVGQVVPVS